MRWRFGAAGAGAGVRPRSSFTVRRWSPTRKGGLEHALAGPVWGWCPGPQLHCLGSRLWSDFSVTRTVGLRFLMSTSGRGSRIALIGSVLVLASPLLLAAGFFLEPTGSGQFGPASGFGVIAAFQGVLRYSLGAWRRAVP